MKLLALLAAAVLLALGVAWWSSTDRAPTDSVDALTEPTPTHAAPTLALERPTDAPSKRSEDSPDFGITPLAPASAASPPQPVEPPYEKWKLEDLTREETSLRETLSERSGPLLQAEIDDGRAEVLSEGGAFTYASRPGDDAEVFGVHSIPNRGAFRSSLSRAEFPEIYAIKDRLLSVSRVLRQRETAAALARSR